MPSRWFESASRWFLCVNGWLKARLKHVLRCFENVLRRNVPTSGSKEPDVGTFLYNSQKPDVGDVAEESVESSKSEEGDVLRGSGSKKLGLSSPTAMLLVQFKFYRKVHHAWKHPGCIKLDALIGLGKDQLYDILMLHN